MQIIIINKLLIVKTEDGLFVTANSTILQKLWTIV